MRSDLVHSANQRLNNRFLLCRMTSVTARGIRGPNQAFAMTINQALRHIAMLPSRGQEARGDSFLDRSAVAPSYGQHDRMKIR
jgi:hypothetical protein